MLRTNTDYDSETVAHVVRPNRLSKPGLIYHKRNETIRDHVFCSFLALLLKAELERRIRTWSVNRLKCFVASRRCSESKRLLRKRCSLSLESFKIS